MSIFNILVRAISKLGRKTLYNFRFQESVIKKFNLRKSYFRGALIEIIHPKIRCSHSIYDRPSQEIRKGCKKRWHKYGCRHRDNGPAIIMADGTEEWYQNGEKIDKPKNY